MRFIIGCLLGAITFTFALWLSGFNFDERNVGVALLFVMGLLASFMGGLLASMADPN
jgi:hypothetical protein